MTIKSILNLGRIQENPVKKIPSRKPYLNVRSSKSNPRVESYHHKASRILSSSIPPLIWMMNLASRRRIQKKSTKVISLESYSRSWMENLSSSTSKELPWLPSRDCWLSNAINLFYLKLPSDYCSPSSTQSRSKM